jgi:predicted DNA-binding transcriptional regulator YafY
MGDYLIFERFVWLHKQVQEKKYPNAGVLAEHFGLSVRTAGRDIDAMRHHLGAPLRYDAAKRGYYYADNSFELPYLHASQEELLAVLLARNLLAHTAGGHISRAIQSFSKKMFSAAADLGLTETRLDEAFSATWYGYSPTRADIFQQVADGLLQERLISFSYTSPRTGKTTDRQCEPHHLQHYMGSWVLIGWCRLRFDWRKFFLSRMSAVKVSPKTFHPRPRQEWHHLLDGAFGIFQGREKDEVVLRFVPQRARWIREQVWHPRQRIMEHEDGSLDLVIPVADFREIKLRILQYGSDVQVIAPETLRDQIAAEIDKMAAIYSIS